MEFQRAWDIASSLGQTDLLKDWDALTPQQKERLAQQIKALDLPTLQLQKELLLAPAGGASRQLTPFTGYSTAGDTQDQERGKQMIAAGLVGCLVVAGGQGTRLRIDGPKGICPVSVVKKKSLFQLIAEKTLAAGHLAGRRLPLAIMTSPSNHNETVAFFEKHRFFGLDRKQVVFFQQATLPLLDIHGSLFLESPDTLSEGPDGNGGALHEFYKQGIWEQWYNEGVRYLNFILVDNALADPFDAELAGFHQRKGCDAVVKATERSHAAEKVGVLAKEGEKAVVVEYSELDARDRDACDEKGRLKYLIANISLFSFSMDFIQKMVSPAQRPMPLHKAFKAVKFLNAQGKTVQAESPMAWKFEKFIFDVLPLASTVDALVYPRGQCFAPLKNFEGSDSFATVAASLEARDRAVLEQVTGVTCSVSPLEVSQDFYYPTKEFADAWRGRKVETPGYIDA